MGMEIEMSIRIALLHLAHKLNDLQGIEYAQRVGQHEAADTCIGKGVHQLKDVFGRVFHSVAPVFEVNIDLHVEPLGVVHHRADVGDVFLRRLLQLVGAVFKRALAQQVDDTAPCGVYPVDRRMPIHEAEHLDTLQQATSSSPVANHAYGIGLAVGHAGGGNLDAIHLQLLEQQTSYHQLLVGHERDAASLLPVAQGGVHDFYFDLLSHASILSLFSTRKSMSSSPFIRQCFL